MYMALAQRYYLRSKTMKNNTKMLIIAKDDFPLETIRYKGKPIKTFIFYWIRRLRFADHIECHACYERRKGIKVV